MCLARLRNMLGIGMLETWNDGFRDRPPTFHYSIIPRVAGWIGLWVVMGWLQGVGAAEATGEAEVTAWGVAELQAAADEVGLHEDPYWWILLHYRDTWRGPVSRIDDPAFFLAKDGKTDPRAELHATLAGFFRAMGEDGERGHPVCRFPARLAWLREQLPLDGAGLPADGCEAFEQVIEFLDPTAATLIFPAAFMNSPASMFGHTLLVFESRGQNRLLARAVNYAAVTQETFGPLFTLKGITGMYPGYYSIEPYYDLVERYNDISHRDMWEYELDLTPEEVLRMIRHTWELQEIYSRYYFFTENCSYNLLHILDAGRPELGLREYARPWVIPMDTVKAVLDRGVVREVQFRPSKATVIQHLADGCDEDGRALALALAEGLRGPAEVLEASDEPAARARILELAAEYTQYLYTTGALQAQPYRERLLPILRERSRLGPRPADPPAEPVRPDLGHDPWRVGVGGGVQRGEGFLSLGIRPAYHALTDAEPGYDPGAQIQFADIEARYYPERGRAMLQRADAVHVVSMSPRDAFFSPTSWRVAGGGKQVASGADGDRMAAYVRTGAGGAWRTGDAGLAACMVEVEGQGGGVLDDGYSLGAGPSVMWISAGSARWKASVYSRALWFGLPDDRWDLEAGADAQYFQNVNSGLQLGLRYANHDGMDVGEVHVRWNRYFF